MPRIKLKDCSDFGHQTGKIVSGRPEYVIEANLKGFLGAAYSLGAILSLPFVPSLNQRVGRRWTIMFGSCVSLVGALIQGFANGGRLYFFFRLPRRDVTGLMKY